jgi:thioredoxin 1
MMMKTTNNCILVQSNQDFETIIHASDKVIALVFASWCPFCVRFLPIFQQYADGKQDLLLFQDDQEIMADQFEVEVVPTVLLFKNGEIVKRLDGILGVGLKEKQLADFINSCNLL